MDYCVDLTDEIKNDFINLIAKKTKPALFRSRLSRNILID